MRFQSFFIALLSWSFLITTGCATLQENGIVNKPEIEVSGLSIDSISGTEIGVTVNLEVFNPNPFSIQMAGYDCQLKLSDKPLLSLKTDEGFQLRSQSMNQVKVPLSIPLEMIDSVNEHLIGKKNVQLGFDATAWLELPLVGKTAFPTSKQIELPIPKVPTISVDGFDIKRMGLTTVDADVRLRINNPNDFLLLISQFEGQLTVNGQKWVETQKMQTYQLDSGKSQTITLPVRLSTLALGSNFMEMMQGQEPFSYALKGQMALGSDLPVLKKLFLPFDVQGKMAGL